MLRALQQLFQKNCATCRGILLVIAGPSGVGKDTIKGLFLKRNPNFEKIVTDTNRKIREGETDGISHNFFKTEEFLQRIREGKYVEYVEVRPGEYKGTAKTAIAGILDGRNVFWQVDEYALAHVKEIVRENIPEMADSILAKTMTVYIAPEDWDQLREQYFRRDPNADEEKFLMKLARDREMWWQYHDRYDYILINRRGKLNDTVISLEKLVAQKSQSLANVQFVSALAVR